MRIAWITDPHLNHVPVSRWDKWIDRISHTSPDALIITGDLSEGDDVTFELERLTTTFEYPIYFVLGNHDFYQGSVASVRQSVIATCREANRLHYLTDCSPIRLNPQTVLMGEDGWGDATIGDAVGTQIRLNDFRLIEDFKSLDIPQRNLKLNKLGQESADRIHTKLATLGSEVKQILMVTHVPPFRESCWYEGHPTDDAWAPFFVCGQVGDVLKEYAKQNPDRQIKVLCGHTHHPGITTLIPNLTVHTGAAEYGYPSVSGLVEVVDDSIVVG